MSEMKTAEAADELRALARGHGYDAAHLRKVEASVKAAQRRATSCEMGAAALQFKHDVAELLKTGGMEDSAFLLGMITAAADGQSQREARLREALEVVLLDADLEDDYATRPSDGRFIGRKALFKAIAALKEHA